MKEGKNQETAAASAGMSVRSARKWKSGPLPSERSDKRHWRTRADPFEGVWDDVVVPLLERDTDGVLEAKTLLEELCRRDGDAYSMKLLRTMQRRVRDWRDMQGPPKEVYFQQEHVPGREAAVDFTHATELEVTIRGEAFPHLLFEMVLSFSGWVWAGVAFGETFEALVDGIQRAFWALGGVTKVLRSDNLSAATHELAKGKGRTLNKRFAGVCEHLGIEKVTRINPGKSHENGVVEQRHFRSKKLLAQALVLRGSKDFESVEVYEAWVQRELESRHNRHVVEKLELERPQLRALPARPVPAFTRFEVRVRKWSTITIAGRIYSVRSRLIGHQVEARQYANEVHVLYRGEVVDVFERLRGERARRIDYRHVVHSLVRKPGAFARYRFREELFPSLTFRRAYDVLVEQHEGRADVEYVRILHLAATTMQCEVEAALAVLLERQAVLDYVSVRDIVRPVEPERPVIQIGRPDLTVYDGLLEASA